MKAQFKYNQNSKLVKAIVEGLIKKKEKFGDYYCPCNLYNEPDTICPCKNYRETGDCHCQLFEK